LYVVGELAEQVGGLVGVGVLQALRDAELHGHDDQSLLSAVVQVAFDAGPFPVGHRHQPAPARLVTRPTSS